jgi:hypothetical protein
MKNLSCLTNHAPTEVIFWFFLLKNLPLDINNFVSLIDEMYKIPFNRILQSFLTLLAQ